MLGKLLEAAACREGSVMDPRRWFWRNSRGANGETGEWREGAVEREEISFWTLLSGPLLADLAPYEVGSLSISQVWSSLCSTTRNEALNVEQ